jgi:hypothetical protein
MRQVTRWSVACLVTVVAFCVTTWICGALVLSSVLQDGSARWGVAASLGVAVAALSALWGHSFASEGPREQDRGNSGCFAADDQDVTGSTVGGRIRQVKDVKGSVRVGVKPTSSAAVTAAACANAIPTDASGRRAVVEPGLGGTAPRQPRGRSDAPEQKSGPRAATASGQYVQDAWVGGEVTQIDQVEGDVTID